MKLKNLLLTIPLALSISCATTMHGALDVSYVPVRIYSEQKKNELRTEVDLHTKTEIGKTDLIIGTTFTTYADFNKIKLTGIFKPTSQNYEIYSKLLFPGIFDTELYAYHNCLHPVNQEYLMKIEVDELIYGVIGTGETKMGVKIKF